jgi:hypothetical protein
VGQDAASIRHHCRNTNVIDNALRNAPELERVLQPHESLSSILTIVRVMTYVCTSADKKYLRGRPASRYFRAA